MPIPSSKKSVMNTGPRKRPILLLLLLIIPFISGKLHAQASRQYDVCVYGATSAGVIAAYTAKKLGKSVVLIEPTAHLGGLTSGGLGYTDIGNKYVVQGLALDFYRKIGSHYGRLDQWSFEPKVAKQTYEDYLREANIQVMYHQQLVSVDKQGATIAAIVVGDDDSHGRHTQEKIAAKMFLDCSYEGDLMARAGVAYAVGREANTVYHETYNGVQLLTHHQFPDGIDPYKVPGDSASGLLWGISEEQLAPSGSGDKKVQAYNIRVCLTTDTANMIPITHPDNYDPARYELLLRVIDKDKAKSLNDFLIISRMPHHKTDINNNGPFSTDMIGMSWNYPEADYATRKKIQKAHDDYTKGFFYFVGHDPRVPACLRKAMLSYGYPKDEYLQNNHWTPQMYVRESRRMIGDYVMTQANCTGEVKAEDSIASAAYTMDSHNCERLVVNGMVKNEGNVEIGGFPPYPISYRALVPKPSQCTNLLVPVCLSASHIAYGSIRMEPIFMVLGQAAATAAVIAINHNETIQSVPVTAIQEQLRANPYADGRPADILVDNKDSLQLVIRGKWRLSKQGGYGPDFLTHTHDTHENAVVRFIPDIKEDGTYQLYTYYPKLKDVSEKTVFHIFDGRKQTQKVIRKSEVDVMGQTSGEWIPLGEYQLHKGRSAYIEVSDSSSDGNGNGDNVIVADAILCMPKALAVNRQNAREHKGDSNP